MRRTKLVLCALLCACGPTQSGPAPRIGVAQEARHDAGAPDEVAEVEAEAAMESGTEVDPATEAETATSEASVEDTIVICDEDGNRYASEEEAKAAGLDEAQYGATYCQYFE